jgi:hypothetical protein
MSRSRRSRGGAFWDGWFSKSTPAAPQAEPARMNISKKSNAFKLFGSTSTSANAPMANAPVANAPMANAPVENEEAPRPKSISFGPNATGLNSRSLPPNEEEEEAPRPKSISFGPTATGLNSRSLPPTGGSRRKRKHRNKKKTRRHKK